MRSSGRCPSIPEWGSGRCRAEPDRVTPASRNAAVNVRRGSQSAAPQPSEAPDCHRGAEYRQDGDHGQPQARVQLSVMKKYAPDHVEVIADRIGVYEPADPDRQLHHPAASERIHAEAAQLKSEMAWNVEKTDATDDAAQRKY